MLALLARLLFLREFLALFFVAENVEILVVAIDRLLDRLPVREHPAEPAVVDVVLLSALRLQHDRALSLALGADKEHGSSGGSGLANELQGLLEKRQRLIEIDDVGAVSLAEDVIPHERIPATGLMAVMHAGFDERRHRQFLFFEKSFDLAGALGRSGRISCGGSRSCWCFRRTCRRRCFGCFGHGSLL